MSETISIYKIDEIYVAGGLTLRDYFAGHVLQSLVSMSQSLAMITTDKDRNIIYNTLSESAYGIADAMLKAREAK